MIKRIKAWIIHRLGGETKTESITSDRKAFESGVLTTLVNIRVFADRMNGISADEWCKRMYGYITTNLDKRQNP